MESLATTVARSTVAAGDRKQPPAAERLRVAIVSDATAGRNGVGTYYLDLIAHLESSVESVQLIAPQPVPDRSLERLALPMPGDRTQRLVWPRIAALHERLRRQRPNLIVLPSIGPFSFFALRYARRHEIPLVLVNHTNFDHLLSLYWPQVVAGPLHRGLASINRWLIRQASAVAALNAEAMQEARSLGADPVRVIGTPVAAEFLRTPLPAPRGEIGRVIYVGRLATEKRVDHVLEAARSLPEVHFTIVGDGPLRRDVERTGQVCPNVESHGWLSRSRVLEEIDRADALVLPSSVETFGTAALEALARRRYVLVRPECGIFKWPTLSKGLFKIAADESLSRSITRLRSMPRERRDAVASESWQAVRDFNRYTVGVWLRFLSDAAATTAGGN